MLFALFGTEICPGAQGDVIRFRPARGKVYPRGLRAQYSGDTFPLAQEPFGCTLPLGMEA